VKVFEVVGSFGEGKSEEEMIDCSIGRVEIAGNPLSISKQSRVLAWGMVSSLLRAD
jgi:hypothetical protein